MSAPDIFKSNFSRANHTSLNTLRKMNFLYLYFLRRFFPLILLSILLPSCTEEKKEDKLPNYQSDIVKTSNALGITWLKEQFEKSPGENVCVSPFPLIMMSSALACGADGETKEQLWQFTANSLCPEGDLPLKFNKSAYLSNIGEINKNFKKQLPGYIIYNGLYINRNVDLCSKFKKMIREQLDVDIDSIDFSSNSQIAVEKINQKVKNNTQNFIKNCLSIENINPNTPGLMLSIIGYKGKWLSPFDEELTYNDGFHLKNTTKTVQIPFMEKEIGSFRESNKYIILWLDYDQSDARFVIILPHKNIGVSKIIREMNKNTFQEYIDLMNSPQKKFDNPMKNKRVLYLPKFEFGTPAYDCKSIFLKQGVEDCFIQGKANFSQMSKENYSIEYFLQKNYLKIDEHRTTAHSTSSFSIRSSPLGKEEIKVNRPFICLIIDKKTTMILFASIINNPVREINAP